MRKAIAIYHAPEGDNEVVHMGGVRFIDGETVEINSDDHPHLMSKLEGNQHFEFAAGDETAEEVAEVPDEKPRRGRPPKNRDVTDFASVED